MCGIAGCVVAPGQTPDRSALETMAAALAHRGPDDAGIEVVGNVGLVHTRLAIVDPSATGHEPMRHPDRDWWLTYNGEVFNHLELRRELPSVAYRGGSDAESLLHALATLGVAALPRLNGLFAFAALDPVGELLLVRDRFGVKPLYFAQHDHGLWFASEINALLAAGISRTPRRGALLHAARHGWANGADTPIEGIERLLPGTVMRVDVKTLRRWTERWYTPASVVDRELMGALARCGPDEIDRRVEESLRASVHARLMSDVPLGMMCSGGLDSSLTTALARERQAGLMAFNASVPGQPDADEGPWAELVANSLGVELHTVEVTPESWCRDLVGVVRHIEYPLNHESSVPMWQIANEARLRGVKVLLSGEGADELFGGYTWVAPDAIRRFQLRGRPARRIVSEFARSWRKRSRRAPTTEDAHGAESMAVVDYEHELWEEAHAAYAHHRGTRRDLEALLLLLLGNYLPHLLNRQDKSTMKASIETREPFLDPELVALALNLPLELRIAERPKAVLRRIAKRHLPAAIGEREKVGFGFDYGRYLADRARPGFLADGMLRELQGVPAERWRAMIAEPAWPLPLWTAEIWMRLMIGGDSVAAVEAELWA